MKKIGFLPFLLFYLFTFLPLTAQTSVAGLFPLEQSGRLVWNFNAGWRFCRGDVADAERKDFDDRTWEVVTVPHSVQLMPAEASGCRNYQGVAWYRKHFRLPAGCMGRDVVLYFEAIMGKQTFYVNGREVKQHEGGYLPVMLNLTQLGYGAGEELVVAIKADNSDDKTYPPGKKQMTLDFAYHGGIYRDVWLIAKQKVAITDAVEARRAAGGGIFVHYANINEKSAEVYIDTEVRNTDSRSRTVTVENTVSAAAEAKPQRTVSAAGEAKPQRTVSADKGGALVAAVRTTVRLEPGETRTVRQRIVVKKPRLWSPETPYLYTLATRIKEGKQSLDGGITKIGIRSFEFVNTDDAQGRQAGFYLNGKKYHQLVGANRHQDFAYVGNALPNSQQWRDAKRLRDAGFTIIRTAHYPQDPSFMDACDELGLFVIVATPGWQYWNKEASWAEKVHENTRAIIRRDRNHPSVLMWEPILNETRYPEAFALEALQITKDEYPYPYRPVAAADMHSAGVAEHYDVLYGWPGDDEKIAAGQLAMANGYRPKQPIFTREFGELVDDWYAHNNLNRASRSWGERPMLVQAMSLYRSTEELYQTTGQFIGGCQWHPFDHQRGYHPDPYWGGIYDAFRQKKTAFDMFAATLTQPTERPLVSIAHEMTQFSERDVTVFSNCDSVRLTMYGGEHCWTQEVRGVRGVRGVAAKQQHTELAGLKGQTGQGEETGQRAGGGYALFKDAWDFFEARNHSYTQRNWQQVTMVAEGIRDGKVVCREERMPSRRSTKLRLRVDDMGRPLVADGSDFVVVVCEVTDDLGHVRRLAKENIRFSVDGEGEIIGDASINANPRAVEWGTAPVLIRSTRQPGKIRVRAEVQFPGVHAPTAAEVEITSVAYDVPMCLAEDTGDTKESNPDDGAHAAGDTKKSSPTGAAHASSKTTPTLSDSEKARLLQEVEAQQADFGIQK